MHIFGNFGPYGAFSLSFIFWIVLASTVGIYAVYRLVKWENSRNDEFFSQRFREEQERAKVYQDWYNSLTLEQQMLEDIRQNTERTARNTAITAEAELNRQQESEARRKLGF